MIRPTAGLAAAALLYGALWSGANAAGADGLSAADRAEIDAMRAGDMEKLVVHAEPHPPIEESWTDQHGNPVSLDDYAGKVVVLNFWATWCPPCLAEMPSLDRLAGRMADEDLAVVPVSTDRGDASRIEAFYEEIDVQHLGVHHDRSRGVSRKAGVLGLPVTALMDRQGREVARLVGDAEWDSPEAIALLTRLLELTAPERIEDAAGQADAEG